MKTYKLIIGIQFVYSTFWGDTNKNNDFSGLIMSLSLLAISRSS